MGYTMLVVMLVLAGVATYLFAPFSLPALALGLLVGLFIALRKGTSAGLMGGSVVLLVVLALIVGAFMTISHGESSYPVVTEQGQGQLGQLP